MSSEKIDCFVRVWAPNELRLGFAISTVTRWVMQPGVRVTVIECEESLPYKWKGLYRREVIPATNFCAAGCRLIEDLIESPIYCASDDDMLIYDRDFVDVGLRLMATYPEYGLISATPTNEGTGPRGTWPDIDIVDSHAVGGACFIRKGLAAGFPDIPNQESSMWLWERMKELGFKQGYTPRLAYLHLGSKYSFSSPVHWVGV